MLNFVFLWYNNVMIIVLCICLNSLICESVRFNLQSGTTKCITEDIKRNHMTVGKYSILNPLEGHPLPESYHITSRVTSPRGKNYHYEDVVERGSFAFTTTETGDYMTCFWAPYHNPSIGVSIDFEWSIGVDSNDWRNIARKGQVDLVEIELRRLYDSVTSIYDEMFYLREREEEMQQLNRSIGSNITIFSIVSIVIVTSVAGLQLWHLKEYFEKKKII